MNDEKYITNSQIIEANWVHVHPLQNDDGGAYMCSNCQVGDFDIDPNKDKTCPRCGALMKGIIEYNG